MSYRRLLILLLLVITGIIYGCKKTDRVSNCTDLKEGMIANDYASVKPIIEKFINGLASKKYTAENLDKLVAAISRQCDINVELGCFDCIKTLPAQSEIILTLNPSLHKVLDISVDTNTGNMKILNMHG